MSVSAVNKRSEASIEYLQPQIFHTLKDVFAYARSKGIPSIEMSHVRRSLNGDRKKYPHNHKSWKAMVIYHHRKDWFDNSFKCKKCRVDVLQIQRRGGDWGVRFMKTDEESWFYAISWEHGIKWDEAKINPDSRKKTKSGKKIPKPAKKPKTPFNRFSDIDVI